MGPINPGTITLGTSTANLKDSSAASNSSPALPLRILQEITLASSPSSLAGRIVAPITNSAQESSAEEDEVLFAEKSNILSESHTVAEASEWSLTQQSDKEISENEYVNDVFDKEEDENEYTNETFDPEEPLILNEYANSNKTEEEMLFDLQMANELTPMLFKDNTHPSGQKVCGLAMKSAQQARLNELQWKILKSDNHGLNFIDCLILQLGISHFCKASKRLPVTEKEWSNVAEAGKKTLSASKQQLYTAAAKYIAELVQQKLPVYVHFQLFNGKGQPAQRELILVTPGIPAQGSPREKQIMTLETT